MNACERKLPQLSSVVCSGGGPFHSVAVAMVLLRMRTFTTPTSPCSSWQRPSMFDVEGRSWRVGQEQIPRLIRPYPRSKKNVRK